MKHPLFSICLLAVTFAAGCNDSKQNAPEVVAVESAQVEVDVIQSQDLRRETNLSASVVGYESARMMSKIDGYVESVEVNIGDMVEKDQLLITLRSPELGDEVTRRDRLIDQAAEETKSRQADVLLAEAQLEERSALLDLRKIELERTENLVAKGALKTQKLDEARFALRSVEAAIASSKAQVAAAVAHYSSAVAQTEVARAELEKAKSLADYREIRAPFAGLVTARMVDPGTFVRPATGENATSLLHIERIDHVRVVVFLPMEHSPELNKGDQVVINTIEAWPGKKIQSIGGKPLTVSRVAQAFDQGSRMMRAEIDIDNGLLLKETDRQLKPGDYGKLTLTLAVYKDQPTVPSSALGSHGDGKNYVMTINDKNQCMEVPVRVLIAKDKVVGLVVDENGVQIGQRIVARGIDRVKHQQTLSNKQIKPFDTTK